MGASQVVTVLFTDLVDSTSISTRLRPEESDRLRDEHFGLLRTAVDTHQGVEVKNLGDGIMAVFSATSAALDCAEAVQQALAVRNATAADTPTAVRIGIAVGEVTEEDGDYFGDAVVEAARLCATAAPGQVLATQLVQATAGRRARQELISIGELRLKGLPEPTPAVEVRWTAPEPAALRIPLPRRCTGGPASGFVGRVGERERIADALKRATADAAPHLVLVGGEPGIGKTSLVNESARVAHAEGATVLYGRADEEVAVPYGPWAEALGHLVRHAPAEVLARLAPAAASLVRIAPDLAEQFDPDLVPTSGDADAARYRSYGAVASALAVAAADAPVLLVLDDLQWADAPSLQLLRYLVSTSTSVPLLVLGTFRESEVSATDALADLLGALHREPTVDRLSLRGLTDVELLDLMEQAAGQQMDDDGIALRDALLAETDGNPFFAGEMLRHLAETGVIYQEAGRWVASERVREAGLPVSVREVIGRRVARLGDAARRLLTTAAVLGRDFDLALLCEVAAADEDLALEDLDRAVEATLVDNVDGGRFTFVHALIEHTLYDALSPARRGRLHQRAAEALEARAERGISVPTGELAHHWARATELADVGHTLRHMLQAGSEALDRLAPEAALRWYREAARLVELGVELDDEGLARLLLGKGIAERQSGDPAHRETLLEAARLAEGIGAVDVLVDVALENYRGFVSAAGVIDHDRVAVLEAASRSVAGTGSATEARVLARLSSELIYEPDPTRRLQLADDAVRIARALDDPATFVAVANDAGQGMHLPERLAERVALAREASDRAADIDDPALRFWSGIFTWVALHQAGEQAEAEVAFHVAGTVAEQLGQPTLEWVVAFGAACRAMFTGDLEEAERCAVRAWELAAATGQPDGEAFFGAQLCVVRMMQGRSDEVVDLFRDVVADNPGLPAFRACYAMMLSDLDRFEDARAELAGFAADGFRSMPRDLGWLGAMTQMATVATELRWVEAAGAIYDQLLPFEDQMYFIGLTSSGTVSYWLACLAGVLDRHDAAEAHFVRAENINERSDARWALAATRFEWGRYLLRRGRPEEQPRAEALLRTALASAQQHGYGVIARRAIACLDASGIR